MGINVRWDNRDKTAVLLEFETEWTFSDLEAAIQRIDDLLVSVPQTVDVVIDVEGARLPKDVITMARSLMSTGEARTNEGRRVVVGANNVIRQGYQLLQKTFPNQMKGREILFADDLDTARGILRGLRQAP
jgi:hypothetical protein